MPDDQLRTYRYSRIRGGMVKDLHGKKNIYYQVNATYFSALGEDEKVVACKSNTNFILVYLKWYLDLFAGKNDYETVKREGATGLRNQSYQLDHGYGSEGLEKI